MRLPRPLYILARIAEMAVSLTSRAINAALLGGSTYQTTSARAHLETGRGWRVLRRVINGLFFWQADHCAYAWQVEITNARKTLQLAGGEGGLIGKRSTDTRRAGSHAGSRGNARRTGGSARTRAA